MLFFFYSIFLLSFSGKSEYLECRYLPGKDKVFVTDGFAVGVRQDYHGILLLDTALQTPVKATEDKVRVELALPEVGWYWLVTFFQYTVSEANFEHFWNSKLFPALGSNIYVKKSS